MSQYFSIHPQNPQLRLIKQAVKLVMKGGLIVYPTDSCYAFGCDIGNKAAMERIRILREVDEHHHFTLVCRDLSEISTYAVVDNVSFRFIKRCIPGPYTFLLRATHDVPRRLQTPKRKTIGLRVPNNKIALALIEERGQPLMSSTLLLPNQDSALVDPLDIRKQLEHHVDLVIDGGYCGIEPTTIVDLIHQAPVVVRKGKGELWWQFEEK